MNKKVLLAAVLASVVGGQVQASTPHSGFSLGANLGVTSVDGKLNRNFFDPNATDNSNFGSRSPVFGLFAGYGWAAGTPGLYLGGEVFGQLENVNAKREDLMGIVNATTKLQSRNTFGAVAKIGYVCKDILFFGKLGVATTKWKLAFANEVPAQSVSTNSRKAGFVAGLGMDYAIARNWTIGGEYLYTTYGSLKLSVPAVPAAAAGSANFTYKPRASTFNVRLKYTF